MREKAKPKFIYFDLGNVLLTFDHWTACTQIGALVGRTAEEIWDIVFAGQLQARYEGGELDSREFYEEVCQRLSDDRQSWPDDEAFHLANSDIFQLHLPVVAMVGHLKSAGYSLGILSNTCETHWNYVYHRFTAIREYFSIVVRSDVQRCSKPDRAIYDAAVEQAGVRAKEVFFVDDRSENVQGALAARWDAVLYESPRQLARDLRSRGVRFNF